MIEMDIFPERIFRGILGAPGVVLLEYWYLTCTSERQLEDRFKGPPLYPPYEALLRVLNPFIFILSLVILFLTLRQLIDFYLHIVAGFLLLLADNMTERYIEEEAVDTPGDDVFRRRLTQLASILTLSYLISRCLSGDSRGPFHRPSLLYALPILVGVANRYSVHRFDLKAVYRLATFSVLLHTASHLSGRLSSVATDVKNALVEAYRFFESNAFTFPEALQFCYSAVERAADPVVLAFFWLYRVLQLFWIDYHGLSAITFVLNEGDYVRYALSVLAGVCRSPVSLMATCMLVMAVSMALTAAVNVYLGFCAVQTTPNDEAVLASGIMQGLIAFLLALQTEMAALDQPERTECFTVILLVVGSSLSQTILELTYPALISVSSVKLSRASWPRHAGALLLTAGVGSLSFHAARITAYGEVGLLSAVIISCSSLTAIQALGYIVQYLLFVYDSFLPEPSESLDDVLYYVKGTVHSLELVSSSYIFGFGLREAWNGSWSLFDVVGLAVLFYFNVFSRIVNGWRSFMQRQYAISHLMKLDDATTLQIATYGDVCSICYSPLSKAKLTKCGHFFHPSCLKKWLFIQDSCPMCTRKVIEVKPDAQDKENEDE